MRGTPQRVSHVEEPADQHGDPRQGPPLVSPAVFGRTARQFGTQPIQLNVAEPAGRPARTPSTPTPNPHRPATGDATDRPTSWTPATAEPPVPARLPARTTGRPQAATVSAGPVPGGTGRHHPGTT